MKKNIIQFFPCTLPFFMWLVLLQPILFGNIREEGARMSSAMFPWYSVFLSLYFFVGLVGFCWLCRRLFRQEIVAYCASLLFLFSSVSLVMVTHYQSVLHFVPGVWIFFFLVAFGQKRRKRYFVGLIASLILMLTTVQPFYFLTVFLVFLFFYIILFPHAAKKFLSQMWDFVKKNKILSALGLLILLAFLVNEGRVCSTRENQGRRDPVSYDQMTENGLSSRMSFEELFVRLGDIEYGNEGILYLPVAAFLILLLGAGLPLHRRTVLWTAMATMLLLLTLTKVTPVHRFFFDHLFCFRRMQHFYLFNAYLLAAAVLVVAETLSVPLTQDIVGRTKRMRVLKLSYVLLIHAGFLFFLRSFKENMMLSTYISVGLSAIYLGRRVFYPGLWREGLWVLVAAILIQPVEVFWHYRDKAIEAQTITSVNPGSPDVMWGRQ